jgi:hypothetical protein
MIEKVKKRKGRKIYNIARSRAIKEPESPTRTLWTVVYSLPPLFLKEKKNSLEISSF